MIRSVPILLLLGASVRGNDDPHLSFALGVLAETRGNAEEASRFFELARLADPQAMPLVSRSVRLRMAAGDRSGAVKLYRDLAAARPDDLGVQLTYTDFLDQQSNGDTLALKLSNDTLEAALAKYPGHPEIIRRLFQHAQSNGDKVRQVELLEMLSPNDPESVLLYTSLSRGMFEAEDAAAREKVDQRFLTSFEAHPEIPQLARAASDHFRDTDRPDQAIDILKRHVEAAPSSLEIRTRLGVLYFTAKRDTEGEAALKEVLEINPQQALAHQSLAKFYRLRNQPDLARYHAGELLKIRGGPPADFIKLADEWLAANDPKQARILLEKAVFDHPENRELVEKLAVATRRDPETREQAARLFREAEAAKPVDAKTDPAFLMESAEALIAEGQSRSAEERLRTAIRAYPADAKKETAAALRRLALLWETENRNADAAKALRQRADALDR
ncbi:MAG: tetratricopeptide repeat protein [Luteolibacter sp.]|uniref:tetratricopeptide repeat protein n=2 Tax=Luteolibacter sp. TaxID=1962973 RepID=UPI003265C813